MDKLKKIFNFKTNWKIFLVIILIIASGLAVWASWEDSETTDESAYIAASFVQLKYHNYDFNPEHPSVSKYFFALPLQFIKLNEPSYNQLLKDSKDFYYSSFWEIFQYGNKFLYNLGNNAEQIIFLARLTSIFSMLSLGILIFFWTREWFGIKAAFFSLILYLFNPLVLAMGHIANPDMISAFVFALSLYIFWKFTKKINSFWLILCGVFLGIALATRFSNLILIPFYLFWMIYFGIKSKTVLLNFKNFILILLIAFLTLWISYGAPINFVSKYSDSLTVNAFDSQNQEPISVKYSQYMHKFCPNFIPANYCKGLMITLYLQEHGLSSYLDGKFSAAGWWYYFPLAFVYKTPLYLIFFMIVLLGLAITKPRKIFSLQNCYLLSIILLFIIFSLKSKMDLGIRYILPIYVISFILLGQIILFFKKIWITIFWLIAVGGIIYTMTIISPRYLTYFNAIAQGPQNGWKHLLDSNLDWGQDAKRLNKYLKDNKIDKIYLSYIWKKEPLQYYFIKYEDFDRVKAQNGYLAISVSNLPANQWIFDQYDLVSRLGNSLYIFKIK